jgi:hypothetical protein
VYDSAYDFKYDLRTNRRYEYSLTQNVTLPICLHISEKLIPNPFAYHLWQQIVHPFVHEIVDSASVDSLDPTLYFSALILVAFLSWTPYPDHFVVAARGEHFDVLDDLGRDSTNSAVNYVSFSYLPRLFSA